MDQSLTREQRIGGLLGLLGSGPSIWAVAKITKAFLWRFAGSTSEFFEAFRKDLEARGIRGCCYAPAYFPGVVLGVFKAAAKLDALVLPNQPMEFLPNFCLWAATLQHPPLEWTSDSMEWNKFGQNLMDAVSKAVQVTAYGQEGFTPPAKVDRKNIEGVRAQRRRDFALTLKSVAEFYLTTTPQAKPTELQSLLIRAITSAVFGSLDPLEQAVAVSRLDLP